MPVTGAARLEQRDADAGSRRGSQLPNGLEKSSSHPLGSCGIRLRQNDGKLISSKASRDVGATEGLAQGVRHLSEHVVAGRVALPVVDLLEVVQVEDRDCPAGAVALNIGKLAGKLLLEAATIEEAG